jgi:murein DD-endopeptidase MepM/ murein hydrolase activator NlpD
MHVARNFGARAGRLSAIRLVSVLCLALAPTFGCGGRSSTAPLVGPAVPGATGDGHPAAPAVRIDRPIRLGAAAGILPVAPGEQRADGAPEPATVHHMRRGDTLYSIARRHGVPLAALIEANGITNPSRVPAGAAIVIPPSATAPRRGAGNSRPRPAPATPPRPSGRPDAPATMNLSWPLGGRITRPYGTRANHPHHSGIDIDGQMGETVRAAAGGEVIEAGVEGRYGKVVMIDHGEGLSTLYAHASRILVRSGDRVDRNDPIAEVGRSGNARGTHLHFELRRNGIPLDPLPLLKSGVLPASEGR